MRLVLVCSLALCACHNELDELYRSSAQDAGAQGGVTGLPLLPARPDRPHVAACEACAAKQCSEVRDHCLEDDACTALLACSGECEDPACVQTCEAELGASPFYDDYWTCVLGEACASECKSGESFACAGDYDWTPAEEARFDVRFRFKTPPWLDITGDVRFERFLVGSQVRACPALPVDCVTPIDSARVGVASSFDLMLAVAVTAHTFSGFLELDAFPGAHTVPERLWWYPLSRAGEVRMVTFNYDTVRQGLPDGLELDAHAPLVVYLTDCLGMGARGVRVELPARPALRPLYLTPVLTFDVEAAPSEVILFPDVPEPLRAAPFTVRAVRDEDGGEVVAERTISVHQGVLTHAFLSPRPR